MGGGGGGGQGNNKREKMEDIGGKAYAFGVGNAAVHAEVLGLGAQDAARAAVLARAGVGALLSSPAAVGVGAVDGALWRRG